MNRDPSQENFLLDKILPQFLTKYVRNQSLTCYFLGRFIAIIKICIAISYTTI
jgi:hypothetical protein